MSDRDGNSVRGRLVFFDKRLDVELAEVGQGMTKRLMVPVPPRKLREAVGDGFGKPPLHRPRRISRDDGVGGNVLGHNGAGRYHGAGADRTARQDYGAMPDPDVVA